MKTTLSTLFRISSIRSAVFLIATCIVVSTSLSAQNDHQSSIDDNNLVNQFAYAKNSEIILFDASNIKQFWIDKSVISRKDTFEVYLSKKQIFESIALRIALTNVTEKEDCSIEVLTETPNVSFSVFDVKSNKLSDSTLQENFLQYNVLKSTFHLEDIVSEELDNYNFELKFYSDDFDKISIKAIILSFSKNQQQKIFLTSPGTLNISKDSVVDQNGFTIVDDHSFIIKSPRKLNRVKNRFYVSDNPITLTVECKNVGDVYFATTFRYEFFSKDHKILGAENYPYKNNNTILHIVSASKGSNKIIVDSDTEWEKNCFLALNAKEDMSDLPNRSLLEGKIVDFIKIDDNHFEIVLDKELSKTIDAGTTVRVHGVLKHQVDIFVRGLQPGEDVSYSHTINKEKDSFVYSSKAIPEGVDYIRLYYSTASRNGEAHSALFNKFVLSY